MEDMNVELGRTNNLPRTRRECLEWHVGEDPLCRAEGLASLAPGLLCAIFLPDLSCLPNSLDFYANLLLFHVQ